MDINHKEWFRHLNMKIRKNILFNKVYRENNFLSSSLILARIIEPLLGNKKQAYDIENRY